MHKQLKQLEDDMMSRLDPALKNRQGEKTSSMDEMPSFTKTVIEGEPINILKHAARYMRKQMEYSSDEEEEELEIDVDRLSMHANGGIRDRGGRFDMFKTV